jgi:hypothetical protein
MRQELRPRSAVRAVTGAGDLASLARRSRTAVSMHCHTLHSKEVLDFIPHYAARIPVVSALFESESRRYAARHGRPLDFARAWWTPPVSARTVFDEEARQIEERLGLRPLVSITDHDSIEAPVHLQVLDLPQRVPVSLEWTVPFGVAYFHLGVHNLPAERAAEMSRELLGYTGRPQGHSLADLLALLDETPGVLVVLNHPHWDIECIGTERHEAALKQFFAAHGARLHALEVNGFRPWRENELTIRTARELGLPLVSGGDRHGCQANTALNVTRAGSFEEFVEEVRAGVSEVVLLPAYREPMAARMLEAAGEILREYPHYPEGRQRWTNRIFLKSVDGEVRPLSDFWPAGGPVWVRAAVRLMCLLGSPRFRPALRLALSSEGAAS